MPSNSSEYLASGTNSPLPMPRNYPDVIAGGEGPYVEGPENRFIDLWMSFGAQLFGHADPELAQRLHDRVDDGWFFSNPTSLERSVARKLSSLIPCAERVRFATTGSDAVAYAVRAARAFTDQHRVLTIEGGYHGVHEGFMESDGVPPIRDEYIDSVPFNDVQTLEAHLRSGRYGAFIIEPVLANDGCVPPDPAYLERARELCTATSTLLIFDEVVTGFRLPGGSAQSYFGVKPDLSTFSKALANGVPLAAVCGREDVLQEFMPEGDVWFGATFNAHPLALSVADLVLDRVDDEFAETIGALGSDLRAHLQAEFDYYDVDATVQGLESMLTVAFDVDGFERGLHATNFNREKYHTFVSLAASEGVLFPPLSTDTTFLATTHDQVSDQTKTAITNAVEAFTDR